MQYQYEDNVVLVDRSLDLGVFLRPKEGVNIVNYPSQDKFIEKLIEENIISTEHVVGVSTGQLGQFYILFKNYNKRGEAKKQLWDFGSELFFNFRLEVNDVENIVKEELKVLHLYNIPMQTSDAIIKASLQSIGIPVKRLWRGRMRSIPEFDNGVRHINYNPKFCELKEIPTAFHVFGIRIRITGHTIVPYNRCWNCGKDGHTAQDCTERYGCLKCGSKIHLQNRCPTGKNIPMQRRAATGGASKDPEKTLESNPEDTPGSSPTKSQKSSDNSPEKNPEDFQDMEHRKNMRAALTAGLRVERDRRRECRHAPCQSPTGSGTNQEISGTNGASREISGTNGASREISGTSGDISGTSGEYPIPPSAD